MQASIAQVTVSKGEKLNITKKKRDEKTMARMERVTEEFRLKPNVMEREGLERTTDDIPHIEHYW